jgi:NAD(P)-dependent dehydrogenase (short-subunit alcohol dehydrogenase family)
VKAGHKVVIGGRRADKGAEVAAKIGATYFPVDVADEASNKNFFAEAKKALGSFDYVLLNAGTEGKPGVCSTRSVFLFCVFLFSFVFVCLFASVTHTLRLSIFRLFLLLSLRLSPGPKSAAATFESSEFDSIFGSNVKGLLLGQREAVPHINQGGKIIYTSAIISLIPMGNAPVYAASKGGMFVLSLLLIPVYFLLYAYSSLCTHISLSPSHTHTHTHTLAFSTVLLQLSTASPCPTPTSSAPTRTPASRASASSPSIPVCM